MRVKLVNHYNNSKNDLFTCEGEGHCVPDLGDALLKAEWQHVPDGLLGRPARLWGPELLRLSTPVNVNIPVLQFTSLIVELYLSS